ncbi:MAG: DUF4405 domain-containing protein [Actinomycetota bacterium]|nr:DUF4405 domain-containing protein [Actinomycetota bacterium]
MPAIATASSWPRRRLQIRSVLSSTMPFGWMLVALTALIPYFLIGRGRGAGSLEMFGVARTTWMSVHVWSSIVVGLLTIAHVILNRRGLVRSYRIVGGTPNPATKATGSAVRPKRGLTWAAALGVLIVVFAGGVAFAALDDEVAGTGSDRPRVEGTQESDKSASGVDSGSGGEDKSRGNQSRGGNGGRG